MARADRAFAEHRRELQLDARGKRERTLRAEQDMREIVLRRVRRKGIQIVAADAALHFWEMCLNLVSLTQCDVEQRARERADRRAGRQIRKARCDRTEMRLR